MIAVRRVVKKASAKSTSIPAPTHGWNARDSLADMDETDAVELINMFPTASDVMVRKGYTEHADTLPDQVESLLVYNGATTQELFGVSDGGIYDVTSSGTVGVAEVSSLTNSRWQHQNISTSGGNFLVAVNGADDLLLYDGSSWTAIDQSSTPAITGVTTANLAYVNLHKNRLWFIEGGTLDAWYLPTDSISGAATKFPLGAVASKGGELMAMATWTIDAGYGVDDLAVWVTSEGEVIVYQGTDPSEASTWALAGVWSVGPPIGRRCLMKFGGDLLMICVDGVVPLSMYLQSSQTNPKVALTDKIQSAMATAAENYKTSFGWQLCHFPQGNMVFVNVPVQEGQNQEQYVMNTITKAWAKFQGWDANCWAVANEELYFGADTFVGKAWNGLNDDGNNITWSCRQAFNYLGSRGREKRFTMMRPIILTNGSPSILVGVDVDFADQASLGELTPTAVLFAVWDTATWDNDEWGGDATVVKEWQGVAGVGFAAAPRMEGALNGIDVRWVSTDIVYEQGGVL